MRDPGARAAELDDSSMRVSISMCAVRQQAPTDPADVGRPRGPPVPHGAVLRVRVCACARVRVCACARGRAI